MCLKVCPQNLSRCFYILPTLSPPKRDKHTSSIIWQLEEWRHRDTAICQGSNKISVVEQRIISRSPWSQINEINIELDTLSTHYPFSIEKFQATYFQCQHSSKIKIQNHSASLSLRCLIIVQIRQNEYMHIFICLYKHVCILTE